VVAIAAVADDDSAEARDMLASVSPDVIDAKTDAAE
jgi:hypothetical protein